MVRLLAGGVLAVLDVDRVVGHLLHAAAHQPAVALLRGHALDLGLLRIEVVGDRVHLVALRPLGELGLRDHRLAFERIGLAVGMDDLRVHVDAYVVGLEIALLVGDVALVVDVDPLVAHVVDQRVGVAARDRGVEQRRGCARPLRRVAPGGALQRIGAPGDERIDADREERIALLPQRRVAYDAAPVFGACAASCGPLAGSRLRRLRHRLRPQRRVGGAPCAERRIGRRAENRPSGRRGSGHQLGEERDDERREDIF